MEIIESFNSIPSHTILRELTLSKQKGNVVGVWAAQFDKVVCLTAVENILGLRSTDDKLIVLKKVDLQGKYLIDNLIYLSEIQKVVSFEAIYDQHLMYCLQDSPKDSHFKIRQREQSITSDDLKMIIIRNINSGNRVTIKRHDCDTTVSQYLLDFNPVTEVLYASYNFSPEGADEIPLEKIAGIEFEFHYYYKGFSSRIFQMSFFEDVSLGNSENQSAG